MTDRRIECAPMRVRANAGLSRRTDSWLLHLLSCHLQVLSLILLGGIAESDSAYCDTSYHCMVCPSVCHQSHSCTLLKLLDGMRCHLAGTLVVPSNILLNRDSGPSMGIGDLGVGTRSLHWCRPSPNYFGHHYLSNHT